MSRRRDILRVLEEDEWEDFLMMYAIFRLSRRERRSRWQYERRWNKLLEKLRHQGKFHTRFRMSETAFNDLVELLRPALKRVVNNSRSKQPIFVEFIVAIGSRWLVSGSYQEIEDVFGVRQLKRL